MATAVKEQKPPKQPPALGSTPGSGVGGFQMYKPGEGYATRLGAFVGAFLFILFTCHHWYYGWTFIRDLIDNFFQAIHLGLLSAWAFTPFWSNAIALAGTCVLLVGGGLGSFYLIYCLRKTSEFLVKTDGELAKVTWPKMTPWFKPDTQVWGATYVVIIVLFFLTIYIMLIDHIFILFSEILFY